MLVKLVETQHWIGMKTEAKTRTYTTITNRMQLYLFYLQASTLPIYHAIAENKHGRWLQKKYTFNIYRYDNNLGIIKDILQNRHLIYTDMITMIKVENLQ